MKCQWCEGEITSKYGKKFCSLSCGTKHQQAHTTRGPKPTQPCVECGAEFVKAKGDQKFCGRSCSASFNGRRRIKHGRNVAGKTCTDCGTGISNGSKGRCGDCGSRAASRLKLARWISGDWDGCVSDGLSSIVRNHLLEVAGFRCSKCGWDEIHPVTGKVPLQVNHIDGDAFNNQNQNLEVLCPNCHSLTPNFGRLNKNGTRTYRYQR